MEASGHARWFERLLTELRFELWIGDAAEIRSKRLRKQKTDRQDAQLILRLLLEELTQAFHTDGAMLVYRDSDLERIFVWQLRSGESERLIPENL